MIENRLDHMRLHAQRRHATRARAAKVVKRPGLGKIAQGRVELRLFPRKRHGLKDCFGAVGVGFIGTGPS